MKEYPNYNTKTRIRDRLRDALRHFSKTGKIRKSNEYLDYVNIIKFLGPCPGNRKDYHIDHINPLCNFDFNDLKEIQKAFAPENHQWLLIEDNIKHRHDTQQQYRKEFVIENSFPSRLAKRLNRIFPYQIINLSGLLLRKYQRCNN